MYDIKDRLREALTALDSTPNAFACKANIDSSNFKKMLDGKLNITNKTIGKICQAHNLSVEWLKSGIGDMISPATTKGIILSPDSIYAEDSEVLVGDAVLKERIKHLQKQLQDLCGEKKVWETERKSMKNKIDQQRKRIDQLTDKLLELK